jgi:SAM-dependent methyltransferase
MNPSDRLSLPRINQTDRDNERWQPPAFVNIKSRKDAFLAFLRRLLDFQAASIYKDLKVLLPRTFGQVLDVGCGAQPYRYLFPENVEYLAIDHASAFEDFGYKSPDTIYYEGVEWPIKDQTIDFILATETLEHVEDPAQFLSEAARTLKPNGEIILTVPFAARWHYIPHDFWRFTPTALNLLLMNAGFNNIRIYCRGNHVTVACYKALAVLLKVLFPAEPKQWQKICSALLIFVFSPVLMILSFIGHYSLKSESGDDTLGYTVMASKL